MTDDELGPKLWETMEAHETAVKRAIASFGDLETALKRASEEHERTESLAEMGRTLEAHAAHLEAVITTLNEQKGAIRDVDGADPSELHLAMEKARRRARVEPRPPQRGTPPAEGRQDGDPPHRG